MHAGENLRASIVHTVYFRAEYLNCRWASSTGPPLSLGGREEPVAFIVFAGPLMFFDLQFNLLRTVGYHDVEGVFCAVIGSLELERVVSERRIGLLRGPVVNHNIHGLPPWSVRALTRTKIYANRIPV